MEQFYVTSNPSSGLYGSAILNRPLERLGVNDKSWGRHTRIHRAAYHTEYHCQLRTLKRDRDRRQSLRAYMRLLAAQGEPIAQEWMKNKGVQPKKVKK